MYFMLMINKHILQKNIDYREHSLWGEVKLLRISASYLPIGEKLT